MYMIQCPESHFFPVPAKSAGSNAVCPTCGVDVAVPKLGDLRKMPLAETVAPTTRKAGLGMGGKIVFAGLLLVAMAAGMTSAFAGFRWQYLPIPYTQEEHIAAEREAMDEFTPLQMIAAWEQIELTGLGEQVPFPYQRMQNLRAHWRNVCFTGLGVAAGSIFFALAVVGFARMSGARADT